MSAMATNADWVLIPEEELRYGLALPDDRVAEAGPRGRAGGTIS